MDLTGPVSQIPKVGPSTIQKLSQLGISTIYDLILHLPFRYEDRRHVSDTTSLQIDQTVNLIGELSKINNSYAKNGKILQTATFSDARGSIACVWFNQKYLAAAVKSTQKVALHGKVGFIGRQKCLISPEIEFFTTTPRTIQKILPVYRQTAGISSQHLMKLIHQVLFDPHVAYPETHQLDTSCHLPDLKTSLLNIHAPTTLPIDARYYHRLAFDELLIYKWQSFIRRDLWRQKRRAKKISLSPGELASFEARLNFKLTDSQKTAISEILTDLNHPLAMNRILVGDVGSGKTVVAAAAVHACHKSGYKSLILAPTQILATQHFHTLSQLLEPTGASIGLITASNKKLTPNSSVIIGTHALLNQNQLTSTPDLGLLVIDEQHRFGVLQRELISNSGSCPHVLSMSATPIPRTVALIKYGELAISFLTDLPHGRKPVKTWVVPSHKRPAALQWLKKQIELEQSQVFIVCPYIQTETSEAKTVKSVFSEISALLPNHKIGILHGQMPGSHKDQVIHRFRSRQIDVLVTTSVIEVGIDIPQANIIVVEQAHLFGLAQLHQLRGRVGRGPHQGYCLLFSDQDNQRLNLMTKTANGQELAEADFQLRGGGDLQGTAQHGPTQFRFAHFEHMKFLPQIETIISAHHSALSRFPVLKKLIETDKITPTQSN